MSSQNQTKRRIFITLTLEEENYYTKIFEKLDYEKNGKIRAHSIAIFMRDSNLKENILKEIFLLTPHKNIHYIEKDEFFILLRLISLAQNKIPFNKESLENNNPIPPLPIFYFLQQSNILNKENIFEINEDTEKRCLKIFEEKKDTKKSYISKLRTSLIMEEKTKDKILELLEPLEYKGFLSIKEFVVAYYLQYLSRIIELPKKLPKTLLHYLGRNTNIKDINLANININNIQIKENNNNKISDIKRNTNINSIGYQRQIINKNNLSKNDIKNGEQINNKVNELNKEKKLKIDKKNIGNLDNNLCQKENIEKEEIFKTIYIPIYNNKELNLNKDGLYDLGIQNEKNSNLLEKTKEKNDCDSLSNSYAKSSYTNYNVHFPIENETKSKNILNNNYNNIYINNNIIPTNFPIKINNIKNYNNK